MALFCHTADTILSWLHQELLSGIHFSGTWCPITAKLVPTCQRQRRHFHPWNCDQCTVKTVGTNYPM